MTEKDQTITPAGEVELNEEELEQVSGGKAAFRIDVDNQKKDYDPTSGGGKTGGGVPHKRIKYGDIT